MRALSLAWRERRGADEGVAGRRCVAMLLLSANEEAEEAKRRLVEWVRMVGAQCPGVRIVLVCTHTLGVGEAGERDRCTVCIGRGARSASGVGEAGPGACQGGGAAGRAQ
eukprot:3834252-Rhodomonas_salina.1